MATFTSKQYSFQPSATPSQIEAANFVHLYWDVVWFGIAFGSTLSFLPIFATRLGATGWQVGLLTAGPALISIAFTLPAGNWLMARSLGPAVTRAAAYHRLGYLLLIAVPLFLPSTTQIWTVLILVLLMAIPGTALAVGFNALLAATVPPEARGHVVGRRNALLAATIMLSFMLSGWLLDKLSTLPHGLEWGYAVVFALGALGAALSTHHIARIRVPDIAPAQMRPTRDRAQPGRMTGFSGSIPLRLSVGMRLWLTGRPSVPYILAKISGQYRWVMVAYFLFHFTQLLPAALFPLFWVRELGLSDGRIGWINAIFYLTMLTASPFLGPLTRHVGNYRLTAGGAVLLALYPLLTAMSTDVRLLIAANISGGVIWAILSGALSNRLLEHIPDDDRPAHLALYNLALNIATLAGTMLGPVLAGVTGLREALIIVVILRIGSGLALARWG